MGTLYLCATPIGNLEDITLRVLRVLKEVDMIAAEDTRNTIKLLNYFQIKTPLTSYHKYNKIEKGKFLIKQIQAGRNIALVTDAGTPAISDPGEDLVRMAYEAGILVTSLPGACACVTALTISGLSTRRFSFEGFLPTGNKRERRDIISELVKDTRTLVIYEAPHRLLETLKELYEALGERRMALCRELTKKHETIFSTTLSEAVSFYEKQEPKGEYVLVIEGKSKREQEEESYIQWEGISIKEHVQFYIENGVERKDAMKQVAIDRGISRREVYQQCIKG